MVCMASNINSDNFFNRWAIMTGIIQLLDYDLNIKQVDNDTLLQHLNKQDKILEQQSQELQKQTNEYLEKIVRQNYEIIEILKNKEAGL